MAHTKETISVYVVMMGRCEGKRSLGKPKLDWKYSTKLYIQGTRFICLNAVNTIINFEVPYNPTIRF